MSTSVIKEFLVKILFGVNTAQLSAVNAGMAEAGASAAVLDKEAMAAAATIDTRLAPALSSLLMPLAAISAAIGLAYHEMFEFVEGSAEGFEKVSHLANRVNTTATAIQRLGYIAQFSRSSVEAAQQSLDGLNRSAGETSLGIGRAKKVFKEIGLSVTDSNGKLKDTSLLMGELGEKIKGMERGKQLAVLEKLGIDKTMIEALTTDVSGLGAEFDNLYKVAGINADEASENAVEFVDALNKVKYVMKTIRDSVAVSFFKDFQKGFESFRKVLMDNLPKIIANIKPVIVDMVKIGGIAIKLGLIFGGVASNIISLISKVNDATGGWALKIGFVTLAIKKLNLAFLRSPIGIILELATAFSLLYDDYKVWERGGKAFIDWGSTSGRIIVGLISTLGILAGAFATYKIGMVTAAVATEGIAIATKTARSAMLLFNLVMAANPAVLIIGGIVAAIAGLSIAGYEMYKHWKEISDFMTGIFSKIGDEISSIVNATEKAFDKINIFKSSDLKGPNTISKTTLISAQTSAAGSSSKTINANQNTNIHVYGSANPYDTANAVKQQQLAVNADQSRNLQGAVR